MSERHDHLPATVAEADAPGPLALVEGFVNTLHMDIGTRRDAFDSPERLGEWLTQAGLIDPGERVSDADLRRALELREALRELAFANNGEGPADPSALEIVERESERIGMRVALRPDGAMLEPTGRGIERAFGRIFGAIHEATLQGTWPRLKACRSDDCRWVFFDSSRNRAGRWCGTTCGNRAKVRAFRQRQRRDDHGTG